MVTGQRWTPEPYHLEAVKWLLQNANAGLFLDPGLGKTACCFAALSVLKQRQMFRRALVVSTRRIVNNVWPVERQKWTDFWHLPVHVLHGDKKERTLDALPAPTYENPDVVCVTFDGMVWLAQNNYDLFLRLDPDVLIVDECTYVRKTKTQRFKALQPVLPHFKRRIIMTGTPAPKSYEDLFGQIYVLDLGNALGRFITHYRMTYFDKDEYVPHRWNLRLGSNEKINARIRPLVLRGDVKDANIKLPQLLINNVQVELPPAAAKVYAELEAKFYAVLESGESIESPTAAALANKLRQVANGFAYNAEQKPIHIHDAKLEALQELVEGLNGKPALLFYEYVADIERIEKALGYAPGTCPLLGRTDKLDAQRIAEFNAGELPILLAHPRSAGHGLNLQESAGHVIFFGPTWDLELYDQAIARVQRRGNTNAHVTVHTLVGRDTMDEVVVRVLREKDRTQRALLAAMKRQPLAATACNP